MRWRRRSSTSYSRSLKGESTLRTMPSPRSATLSLAISRIEQLKLNKLKLKLNKLKLKAKS
jgi:hypothetical protein